MADTKPISFSPSDFPTKQQWSTLRFRREVTDRFGVLPNFFCSADAAPGLAEELWKFAKSAYLDSPLPSLFKERLFVHLSRFCEIRYCIVRHVGFLIGQGRPAGDADAGPETIEQVIEMLRRPLPEGPALTKVLERLERVSLGGRLPEPRTESEADLFDALTIMFLAPRDAARARVAVRAAVGDATFELLVAYLAFIRTAHYWTEMHPELTYEPDMVEILRGYGELADLLLDTSEAELVQGGVRLRETLHQLKRVEVALQESESRHAFLLRLGDALRPLVDPMAIQGEASRLLGERLLTDRAYYAEIDEAQGCIVVERNFVRAGVSSRVGRYSLSDFNWVGPTFRMGGPVVVADTQTSPLIPDADRPAVAAVGVGAFVAAPLIRDGRLVAALFVNDLSPRDWTPDEVELVKETAERTWEAIERARAEEQLRQANARKDEFLAMLAHELRNPLAPIRTGLELIRRGGDTVVAVERVRGIMERQVGHMVRLIDDLLDVSRITSGKIVLQREPTLLASLVHSAVEANRAAMAAKRIDLSVDLPKDPCVIDVDPTRFVQILSNLLHNAAKFTNDGGSVRISATITQPRAMHGPQVSISVVDSGIGISPELLPRVFDLFTQGETRSSQPGLGIGLALARRLVELHAGRLDARSEGARARQRVRDPTAIGDDPIDRLPPRGAPTNAGSNDEFWSSTITRMRRMRRQCSSRRWVERRESPMTAKALSTMLHGVPTRSDPPRHRDARARRIRDLSTDSSCSGRRGPACGVDRVRPGTGQGEGDARRIRRAPNEACRRGGVGGDLGSSC